MKTIPTIFFLLFSVLVFAQEPTYNEINQIAETLLNEQNNREGLKLKSAIRKRIQKINPIVYKEKISFHVADLYPAGFIVLSNNKLIEPIIAYSKNSNYIYSNDSSNFLFHLILNDIQERERINELKIDKWENFKNTIKSPVAFEQWPIEGTTNTGGWIETIWHQGHPYNSLFPIDPITNNKVVTGCVTTAFAQLLNYHKTSGIYPLSSVSRYTSTGLNNTVIQIDNDYNRYDFTSFNDLNNYINSIQTKYSSGNDLTQTEISALNFLAAIMVQANFSSVSTAANIYNIPARLKDFFKYASCDISHLLNSSVYSSLKNNMRLGLPALISVQSQQSGGHLIICDGYNSDDFFHLNFGWGANSPENISDVWYNIPQNIPAGFTILNSIIYNIKPNSKDIYASKSIVELFPEESLSKATFEIFSNKEANITLECNNVEISKDNVNYSKKISDMNISSGYPKTIWVKYNPEESSIEDYITISHENEIIDYVDVKGYSLGNIIQPGLVNGVWDDKKKPYLVTGDVTIDSKQSLTIKEGVTIYFLNEAGLKVKDGILYINGTAMEPITFTTLSDEKKWKGIEITNSGDDDIIQHAIITNANNSGIKVSNSDPLIINCFIANNRAAKGGGISLFNSNTSIIGCIIVNNFNESWQANYGGGLYAENSNIEIINTTFNKNTSIVGGAIYANNSNINLINTILWDNYSYLHIDDHPNFLHKEISFNIQNTNITASNCIIKDLEGTNRFNQEFGLNSFIITNNVSSKNPMFIKSSSSYGQNLNPQMFNWRLSKASSAINNGATIENDKIPSTDIYGNPRIRYNAIDIGAAESIDSARFLTVTPLSYLDFPVTNVDSYSIKPIKIKNSGVDSVWVSMNSNNKNLFSTDEYYDRKGMAPGDSLLVNIKYSPQIANNCDTGYFVIYTTSDNYIYEKIRLTGVSVKGKFIEGPVSGIWDKENSPYIVIGDTWIKENDKLEIREGTKVLFAGNYSFSVNENSKLNILGNYNDTVNFVGLKPWKGIFLNKCNQMPLIDYLKISGVKNSFTFHILESPVKISNSYFQNNENCIWIENNTGSGKLYDIRNNLFSGNFKNVINYLNDLSPNSDAIDTLLVVNNIFQNNNVYSLITSIANAQIQLKIDANIISDNLFITNNIEHKNKNKIYQKFNNSISKNVIYNNISDSWIGIKSVDENIAINNNLIVHNRGSNNYLSNLIQVTGGNTEILNNTISNNDNKSSVLYLSVFPENSNNWDSNHRHQILNNIFNANQNSEFSIYSNPSMVNIDYNLCNNEFSNSNNNKNINPGFNQESNETGPTGAFNINDWYLKENSDCVDAGHPDRKYFDIADKMKPDFARFPAMGSLANDMGAFGGNNCNFHETEYLTICEGDSYWGFKNEGIYYRNLTASNGKDSLITVNLKIIESDLDYNNPQPSLGAIIPPYEIGFSWMCNSSGEELSTFRAYFSLDNKIWKQMYNGSDKQFSADFIDSNFSGKTIYWYVSNYDAFCPRQSPLWHFTVDLATAAKINSDEINRYSIFPNPNNGKFKIELGSGTNDILLIKIYNTYGQLVYNKNFNPTRTFSKDIDISDLGKGVYYLKGNTDNKSFTKKIIVQ
jgi:hypothetical protein